MNKKRLVIGILITLVVLVVAIISFFVVRNINDKPPVVVEQSTSATPTPTEELAATSAVRQTTTFKGVDDIHWGKGAAEVLDTENGPRIVFGEDFEVAQGPDLFVYLSPNEASQELGEYASLGNLKSNSGTQEYVLPENYKDYKTLVIWCRAFGVTFATADLN